MGRMIEVTSAGVLFDMDGTLVDSTVVVEAMWTQFAVEHGLAASAVIPYSHGRPTLDTLTHFLPALPAVERTALEAKFTAEEVARTDGIVEIPGAADLLARLIGMGAPVAVVTSASAQLARSRMGAAGVAVPQVLLTPEDVVRGKPAPDGYLHAAARLGIPIASCLVFEDSEAGLVAARACGAHVVVVGAHQSPTTAGIDRVPDLTRVAVERNGDALRVYVR